MKFHKKVDFTGRNWPFTATSGQIILFLFQSHHFRTYFLYMIRYNNILRPPATTPPAQNLGVATPNPPGLTPMNHIKLDFNLIKKPDLFISSTFFTKLLIFYFTSTVGIGLICICICFDLCESFIMFIKLVAPILSLRVVFWNQLAYISFLVPYLCIVLYNIHFYSASLSMSHLEALPL